jgi:hypothetical protein
MVHSVRPPTAATPAQLATFQAYLTSRALGPEGQPGRPFLWPSAKEYVAQCLPGPKLDAVVAMPTGSGKSFVAELGIADALTRGSVIYLAPTNALVHQIRRDLRVALAAFTEVDVIAFLSGGEYSGQFEDLLGADSTCRFVAVMTAMERALLNLRAVKSEDLARSELILVFAVMAPRWSRAWPDAIVRTLRFRGRPTPAKTVGHGAAFS